MTWGGIRGGLSIEGRAGLFWGAICVLMFGLLPLGTGAGLGAQDVEASAAHPWMALRDPDPLELGRIARRVGDGAVLKALGDRRVSVQLWAIRTSPRLRAPESALDALIAIAAGRDPHLAPAASRAVLEIARGLDASMLTRREADRDGLRGSVRSLLRLASDRSARPDLREASALAADLLAHLD